MPEAVDANTIDSLGRAILAQLSPLTGARASGEVSVTAGAAAVVVPANTYLLPVVRGELRDDLPFKTVGDWQVNAGATSSIPIVSNVGGARMNLDAATVFRFDPPIDGVEGDVLLDAPGTAGGNDDGALLRRMGFFEDLDAQNASQDIFAGKLTEYPALMLTWQNSEPAEGAMAGLRQGNNRGRRAVKFFREYFVAYIAVGRLAADRRRRQEGLVAAQAASRLLTDRLQNDDGEQLCSVGGGVEIIGRTRVKRGPRHYIYAVRLRVNQVLQQAADTRVFHRWETTRIVSSLEAEPEALPVVDISEPMP